MMLLGSLRTRRSVIIRPIYEPLYREMKWRQRNVKSDHQTLHVFTGIPGTGKSYFAPVLSRLILTKSDRRLLERKQDPCFLEERIFKVIDDVVLEEIVTTKDVETFYIIKRTASGAKERSELLLKDPTTAGQLYVIRDPPKNDTETGNLAQSAKMRFILASFGYLPHSHIKGRRSFLL